jgi:hypothetical protein
MTTNTTSTPLSTREALWRAAAVLTGRDADHAAYRNDVGWDGQDTKWGHRVVETLSPAEWSDEIAADAYATLRKYRAQLASAGIDYDSLPRPVRTLDDFDPDAKSRSRQAAREAEYAERDRHRVDVDDDGRLVMSGGYNADLVARQRAIPGRRWDAGRRVNTFPASSAAAVLDLAADFDAVVSDAARAAAASAPAVPTPLAEVRVAGDRFIFDFPWDPDRKALVANLPGRKWDPRAKVWTVPLDSAARVAEIADRFVVDADARDVLDEIVAEHAAAHALSRALDSDFEPANLARFDEYGVEQSLYGYQRAGVEYAVRKRRALIGDEQGLGKTMQALAAVLHEQAFPAVVVCPPNVWGEWQDAFRRWSERALVVVGLEGRPRPDDGLPVADVYVVSESVVADYRVKTGERDDAGVEIVETRPGWAAILSSLPPAALIVDEGQDYKNRGADRTKAMIALGRSLPDDAMRLECTGTAIELRPAEVLPQLDMLGVLDKFGGTRGFKYQYLGGSINGTGTPETRKALHDDLRRICMIRRNEEDALPDLPTKTRRTVSLSLDDLDPEIMAEYADAEADVVDYLWSIADALARQRAEDPESVTPEDVAAAMDSAVRAAGAEILVRYGKLRQLTGRAKLAAAVALIRSETVDVGEPAIVFAHHREVVAGLVAGLDAVKIDGSVSARDRQAIVKAFQRGERKAIVIATRAGGTGITLTRAARSYTVEWDWNAARHAQAEKRNHRIGQQRPVVATYVDAPDAFDPTMRDLVLARFEIMEQTLADRPGDNWDSDDVAEAGSVVEITRRFLDPTLRHTAVETPGDVEVER